MAHKLLWRVCGCCFVCWQFVLAVTPVTALLLGHWLNGEAIEAGVWFGTALILSGLLVHQWDQLSRRLAAG